ncbi:ferrochelatase [Candidatus Pelagibacter sp. HIMB1715]|uniref:ferrochelatase n=1 Tax=Candidatus Pelagibacter sp. HIMB1715 TaxID=3413369 RepID=UPI003F8495CC
MDKNHPPIKYGKTGVLIINLGTPDSTNWFDIRKYLKEFLSDRRVIEVNPIIWHLILNLFILTFRPSKTAKAYKEIWMKNENMSPLLYYTKKQSEKISQVLKKENIIVDFAMRYGNPSIKTKIYKLHEMGCENLVILPLYPQYAAATTATVCDEVYRTLMKMRWQPSLKIIPHYESNPLYIDSLVNSINKKINEINWKPDLIIASYHGIPKKYFDKGDPYHCYCHKTTRLMSEKFNSIKIQTTFQSRFGPQEWLQPYTDKTLENLPKEGTKNILTICPGFSSDCVETLEEILIQGKESFINAGGQNFDMVPCLNDNDDHIFLIKSLIEKNL